MRAPSIVDFVSDPQLLGLSTTPAQRVVLKTRTGEPLVGEERDLWPVMTGLGLEHYHSRKSITLVAGARSGKGSRICAPLALHESIFGEWQAKLTKGERGVCAVFAQGQREAGTLYSYVKGQLAESPLLRSQLADDPLKTELVLTNGARILTYPCTARSARGSSIFAGILDEAAWYRVEGGQDADAEVRTSVRRGMLGFDNPLMVTASTPFAKAGIVWDDFRQLFGVYHPDAVCFHGPTTLFNSTITAERLEVERRLDPSRFAREYLAEFSEDVDTFLPRAWIDAAIAEGVHERTPVEGRRSFAAIDPSGAGADAFSLVLVTVEGVGDERRVVQTVSRAWQSSRSSTVDLAGVVQQAAEILRAHGCREAVSDSFAAGWVSQAFAKAGIKLIKPEGDRTRHTSRSNRCSPPASSRSSMTRCWPASCASSNAGRSRVVACAWIIRGAGTMTGLTHWLRPGRQRGPRPSRSGSARVSRRCLSR
jgi:hypothetical protein